MIIDIKTNHLKSFLDRQACKDVETIIENSLHESIVLFPGGQLGGPITVDVCHSSIWPNRIIPQWGLGGYSPEAGRIWLYIDPTNPHVRDEQFATRLEAIAQHELHHAERWRKPGYGETLGEHLITEGLAQSFELERGYTETLMIVSGISDDALADLAKNAILKLDGVCDAAQHDAFFYGVEGNYQEYPPLGGYTLGVALTESWLEKNNKTAAEVVNHPAKFILDSWRQGEINPATLHIRPHRPSTPHRQSSPSPFKI